MFTSRRRRIALLSASALLPLIAFIPSAQADSSLLSTLVMNVSSTWNAAFPDGHQLAFDGTDKTASESLTDQRVEVAASNSTDGFELDLGPVPGQHLTIGHYANPVSADTPVSNDSNHPRFSVDEGTRNFVGADFDILDLATDSRGNILRIDLTFRSGGTRGINTFFGEVRLGEPETSGRVLSARRVHYPDAPVGGIPLRATVAAHNTSAVAEQLGAISVIGADPRDFVVTADQCSRRLLPAQARCLITISFAPSAPGNRSATLQVPLAGAVLTTALDGTAPSGFSNIHVHANLESDYYQTYDNTQGPYQLLAFATGAGNQISFAGSVPYEWQASQANLGPISVVITAPAGQQVSNGHHLVGVNNPNTYFIRTYLGEGCDGFGGAVDISDLTEDGNGVPLTARIKFSFTCAFAEVVTTGEINYRISRPIIDDGVTQRSVPGGRRIAITGTSSPGAAVAMYFRAAGVPTFSQRRSLVADSTGRYGTTYIAETDEAYYVVINGQKSNVVTARIVPTIQYPSPASVSHVQVFTLTGSGTPNTTLILHFHRQDQAPGAYLVRTVPIDANGNWTRPFVVNMDYVIQALSSTNGTMSAPLEVDLDD